MVPSAQRPFATRVTDVDPEKHPLPASVVISTVRVVGSGFSPGAPVQFPSTPLAPGKHRFGQHGDPQQQDIMIHSQNQTLLGKDQSVLTVDHRSTRYD
jgi:hypothetical protein